MNKSNIFEDFNWHQSWFCGLLIKIQWSYLHERLSLFQALFIPFFRIKKKLKPTNFSWSLHSTLWEKWTEINQQVTSFFRLFSLIKNLHTTGWIFLRTFSLTCVVCVTNWMTAEPFCSLFLLLFFSHSCPPFPSLSPLLASLSSSSFLGDSPGLTHQLTEPLNHGTCHNSFLPLIRSSSRRTQPDCGRLNFNLRRFNKQSCPHGSDHLRPGGQGESDSAGHKELLQCPL